MTEEDIISSDKKLFERKPTGKHIAWKTAPLKKCECGRCNEWIPSINKLGFPARFKHGHNSGVGVSNTNWRGGKTIDQVGYVLIRMPNHPRAHNSYVREHIVVMEKKIGRPLLLGEVVHHINGIRSDNRPENLQLLVNQGLHNKYLIKDMSNRQCCDCKSYDTYKRRWYKTDNGFCCQKCHDRRRYRSSC